MKTPNRPKILGLPATLWQHCYVHVNLNVFTCCYFGMNQSDRRNIVTHRLNRDHLFKLDNHTVKKVGSVIKAKF